MHFNIFGKKIKINFKKNTSRTKLNYYQHLVTDQMWVLHGLEMAPGPQVLTLCCVACSDFVLK